ncbi:translation initiation factor eIF-2B subunit epsilon [Uranotaenia lowii]|uniref:translation initiation factor eIF-2B subunit epsilon n=1 Tax=Uranotaenia lowii TaxID=190385 RepID=UPI00247967B8|nr:translation initiation factor eIF-2B subunit epsilon [Uranotaenia lowii]
MNQLEKKEPVQAILIADGFNECFVPFTDDKPLALLPLVNVPLIDYSLESLNRSGVEEVFLFCSQHVDQIREQVRVRQSDPTGCSWTVGMTVTVVSSEGCRCLGDALRDLDAKGLIRGNFILMGVDTITNANLGALLEEHKRMMKTDKGTAMTVIFKEGIPQQRTGNEVFIAMDKTSRRLLYHQRLKPTQNNKERSFNIPLEILLENRDVTLKHGLGDPQLAICSNTALPLFSDNFDFANRDDFVRGLLINEEILASTIYVSLLPREEYAVRVNNWQGYQIVSKDVVSRFVYPLVPDMGICGHAQRYSFGRNNVYRHRNIRLARGSILRSDVVVGERSEIDEKTVVESSVLGSGCRIGKNCKISNCFLMDGVEIGDGCELEYCIIGVNAKIGQGCQLNNGCILGQKVEIPIGKKLMKTTVQCTQPDDEWTEGSEKIGPKAFTIPDSEQNDEDVPMDSDDEDNQPSNGFAMRLSKLDLCYAPSDYSSSSEDDDSRAASPVQDDSNIFLSEVIESLKRGYSEKSNTDYLILEINSSRYAYNMSLSEVNFFVVKAILQILIIQENVGSALVSTFGQLLGYFGPVFKNYIRDRDSMMDCMKALEETAQQEDLIQAKMAQVVHLLYEKDYVSEGVILKWYEELPVDDLSKKSLAKLVDWLMQSSEEEDDDEDESE